MADQVTATKQAGDNMAAGKPAVKAEPLPLVYFQSVRASYMIYRVKPEEGVDGSGKRYQKNTGRRIEFRKFGLCLDPNDPEQLADVEFLRSCGRNDLDYVEVSKRDLQTRKDKGALIERLHKMDPSAIYMQFTPEEVQRTGLSQNATTGEMIAEFLALGKSLPDQ